MREARSAPESGDDWETHWGSYAASNTQNPAQTFRRRLIMASLDLVHAATPVRLIELGCGNGELACQVLRSYPSLDLVGLDRAETAVSIARRRAPNGVFETADLSSCASLPERYRGFATHAVCSEVLEHVDDPVALLENVRALFAPGCRLVVTVPAGPISAFDRHLGHRRHFTPTALRGILESAGFTRVAVDAAGFPFFNLYRLVVLARGRALIRDATGDGGRTLPRSARLAMSVFSSLFLLNRAHGRHGWQLVAVAFEPVCPT
ncbi:MAG: class I SAM-dependent methyltransferase [Polyangiaceae bacterium]|nr:class I SAM-dependent methyltransferase [Polyangiaceae bacterium]